MLMLDNTDEQGSNAGWWRTVGATSSYNDNFSLQPGKHVGQRHGFMNISVFSKPPASVSTSSTSELWELTYRGFYDHVF